MVRFRLPAPLDPHTYEKFLGTAMRRYELSVMFGTHLFAHFWALCVRNQAAPITTYAYEGRSVQTELFTSA